MCKVCSEAVNAIALLASSDGNRPAGKTSTRDPPQKDRGTENKHGLLAVGVRWRTYTFVTLVYTDPIGLGSLNSSHISGFFVSKI